MKPIEDLMRDISEAGITDADRQAAYRIRSQLPADLLTAPQLVIEIIAMEIARAKLDASGSASG